MSTKEMTPHSIARELEHSHDPLIERYRDASAALDETPNPRVRAAVLAEAHKIARDSRAPKPIEGFAKKRAANDGLWRYAAAASVVVAGLAVFVVNQWQSGEAELVIDEERAAASAVPAMPAAATPPAPSPTAESAAVASASNPVVADVLRTTPLEKVTTPSVSSNVARDAAQSNRSETPRSESKVAIVQPSRTLEPLARGRVAESAQVAGGIAQQDNATAQTMTTQRTEDSVITMSANGVAASPPIAAAAPAARAVPPAPVARGHAPLSTDSNVTMSAAAPAARDLNPLSSEQKRATIVNTEAPETSAQGAAHTIIIRPSGERQRVGDMTESMQRGMAAVRANSNLRAAVQSKDLQKVRAALASGADANLIETNGMPLLAIAVQNGDSGIALALLRAGADAGLRDRAGVSARDYAERSGNRAIIDAMNR
jgi:hypothetical protein